MAWATNFGYNKTVSGHKYACYVIKQTATGTADTVISAAYSLTAGATATSNQKWTAVTSTSFTAASSVSRIGEFEKSSLTPTIENGDSLDWEDGSSKVINYNLTLEGIIKGLGTGTAQTTNLAALDLFESEDNVIIAIYNETSKVLRIYPSSSFSYATGIDGSIETVTINANKNAVTNKSDISRYYTYG